MAAHYTISEVNQMTFNKFQDVFGNVIENCRFCAGVVWSRRPFADVGYLHKTFSEFLDLLPYSGKEGIVRGFPDLSAGSSSLGKLTKESVAEQSGAGLLHMSKEEQSQMQDLNELYKSKFGFPFVICVRQNRKEAILEGLKTRLSHSQGEELNRAIAEAKKIAYLRLLDLVQLNSKGQL